MKYLRLHEGLLDARRARGRAARADCARPSSAVPGAHAPVPLGRVRYRDKRQPGVAVLWLGNHHRVLVSYDWPHAHGRGHQKCLCPDHPQHAGRHCVFGGPHAPACKRPAADHHRYGRAFRCQHRAVRAAGGAGRPVVARRPYQDVCGDSTKNLDRFRVCMPTSQNLAGLTHALQGVLIANVPMITLTIDPCMSCTERWARHEFADICHDDLGFHGQTIGNGVLPAGGARGARALARTHHQRHGRVHSLRHACASLPGGHTCGRSQGRDVVDRPVCLRGVRRVHRELFQALPSYGYRSYSSCGGQDPHGRN